MQFDGTSWSYSPIKYWPAAQDDLLSFYAYWPYSEKLKSVISVDTESKSLTYTYTGQKLDIDILAAKAERQSHSGEKSRGNLNFSHLLTRVLFKFRNDLNDNEYRMEVQYVKLDGTMNSSATYGLSSGSISYGKHNAEISLVANNTHPELLAYSSDTFTGVSSPFYVIPDKLTQIHLEVGIDIYRDINGTWTKVTSNSTPCRQHCGGCKMRKYVWTIT